MLDLISKPERSDPLVVTLAIVQGFARRLLARLALDIFAFESDKLV